jgi:8-oxo-dGDP phosphatase
MGWEIHGGTADLQQPLGEPVIGGCAAAGQAPAGEHHVVRMRHLAVAAAVHDRKRVLMMWRHRFITDTWAWDLPMGLIEEDETPEQAAVREAKEETGWRVGSVKPLVYGQSANGITDPEHHVFRADAAIFAGPPTKKNESDRIDWIPLANVRGMIDRREVVSSGSLIGLLYLLLDEATAG